jgi:hypothetical protein
MNSSHAFPQGRTMAPYFLPQRSVSSSNGQEEEDLHREWEEQEIPFLLEDRPWERATVIVAGRPALEYDPNTQVVTAQPAPRCAEIT